MTLLLIWIHMQSILNLIPRKMNISRAYVDGKLRFGIAEHNGASIGGRDGKNSDALIVPLAQDDVMNTFLSGMNEDYIDVIRFIITGKIKEIFKKTTSIAFIHNPRSLLRTVRSFERGLAISLTSMPLFQRAVPIPLFSPRLFRCRNRYRQK